MIDEAKKLLQLIAATWPEYRLVDVELLLQDTKGLLENRTEKEIEEKKHELNQTSIRNLLQNLGL